MPENFPESPLESFCRAFARHDVAFPIIGGQAELLHGSDRATFDYDFCYRRDSDNIKRLAAAIAEFHPQLRVEDVAERLPFRADAQTLASGCNFTLTTERGDLDLLGYVEPLGEYDAILRNADRYAIGDLIVHVISIDDLITIKRYLNRPKDRESLLHLQAIKSRQTEA